MTTTGNVHKSSKTVDCGWCHGECDPRRAYEVAGQFFCTDACKRDARDAALVEAAKTPADPY